MATTYTKGRLYKLKIVDLHPDPKQARKYIDPIALNELTASIQKHGVLTPIQFRQNEEAALFIVAGHRRTQAAGKAGLTEIPGTFTAGDTRLQGFVENVQRENLLPIDEAEEMSSIMTEYSLNQTQLAESLGKGQPAVSETLTLNRLPVDIRDACRTNPNIPKTELLKIAKIKEESSMRRKFETYMEQAAKSGSTTPRKQRLSPPRALITRTDELGGKFMNASWREWSEDDQNDLANAIKGIRDRANDLLADMNRLPEGEEEPEQPRNNNLA